MSRVRLVSATARHSGTGAGDRPATGGAPVSGSATAGALRVLGELPATLQPFTVERVYQGPPGQYEESILLLDPDDVVLWQQPYHGIRLHGETTQAVFSSTLDPQIQLANTAAHRLVFVVGQEEAGRIDVTVAAPQSARSAGVLGDALETALKKGSIVWVGVPQVDGTLVTRPAWYVQQDRSIYVLTGPGEQELPNLAHVSEVQVTVKSKEIKAEIGVVKAAVRVVDNTSDEFDRIATLGMGTRLNLPDGDGALERWRASCVMAELALQV